MSLASEQECSTIGIKCLPPLHCVTNVLRKTAAENMYSYTFDSFATKVFVRQSLNSAIRHLLFSFMFMPGWIHTLVLHRGKLFPPGCLLLKKSSGGRVSEMREREFKFLCWQLFALCIHTESTEVQLLKMGGHTFPKCDRRAYRVCFVCFY